MRGYYLCILVKWFLRKGLFVSEATTKLVVRTSLHRNTGRRFNFPAPLVKGVLPRLSLGLWCLGTTAARQCKRHGETNLGLWLFKGCSTIHIINYLNIIGSHLVVCVSEWRNQYKGVWFSFLMYPMSLSIGFLMSNALSLKVLWPSMLRWKLGLSSLESRRLAWTVSL